VSAYDFHTPTLFAGLFGQVYELFFVGNDVTFRARPLNPFSLPLKMVRQSKPRNLFWMMSLLLKIRPRDGGPCAIFPIFKLPRRCLTAGLHNCGGAEPSTFIPEAP
jgi:hypothetical protein